MTEEAESVQSINDSEDGGEYTNGGLLTQQSEEEEEEVEEEEDNDEAVVEEDAGGSSRHQSNGDGDDNDESSDDSSSSSSSDDEEEEERELTMNEKRARNIKRNQERLEMLGLSSGLGKKRQPEEDDEDDGEVENDGENQQQQRQRPRGMLLSTSLGFNRRRQRQAASSSSSSAPVKSGTAAAAAIGASQSQEHQVAVGDDGLDEEEDTLLDGLYDKYPHRESQVRLLLGLLAPVHVNNESVAVAAPAPVLISGPSATGKTAVVRDILNVLLLRQQQQQQQRNEEGAGGGGRSKINNSNNPSCSSSASSSFLATAYVNCTTLDVPSSMEELTNSAYRQFEAQIMQGDDNDDDYDKSKNNAAPKKKKKAKRKRRREEKKLASAAEGASSVHGHRGSSSNNGVVDAEEEGKEKKKSRTHLKRSAAVAAADNDNDDKRNKKRTKQTATTQSSSAMASLSSVYRFGRNIRDLFRNRRHMCYSGILVVDHADRLLSFLSSRNNNSNFISKAEAAQCNLLGQLLLVSRTLGINLTVVAITNSFLLEHSRLNTPISSVYSAAQPICIRFPAYRGKSVIKEVLKQPHMVVLITGGDDEDSTIQQSDGRSSTFRQRVVDAFIDTLVQSLQSTTLDIRDMVRIGRQLFVKYIQPVNGQLSLEKTIESARKALPSSAGTFDDSALQKEIISILDRKILPAMRHELERGLWSLECSQHDGLARNGSSGGTSHDLPLLAKYLLLAAFLCQVNRPDRDRDLFSIQKNGRRRKRDAGRSDVEDVAFGPASVQEQPKVFRPKTFPMERMLSVYVSMVGLNTFSSSIVVSGEERLRSLGGGAFFDNIAQLRDIGLLHEFPRRSASETIRMTTEPRFWSSLTEEDAKAIASSLNFPLDRYIL